MISATESGPCDSGVPAARQPDLIYKHSDLQRTCRNFVRCIALVLLAGEFLQFWGTHSLAHPWQQIWLGLYPGFLFWFASGFYLVPIVNQVRYKAELDRRRDESLTYLPHGFQWRKGDRIMEIPWTAVQRVRRLSSLPLSLKFNLWEVKSSEGIFTIFEPGLSKENGMLLFSIRLRMGNEVPATFGKVTWFRIPWMCLYASLAFRPPALLLISWGVGCILFCAPSWRTDFSYTAPKPTPPNFPHIADPSRDE